MSTRLHLVLIASFTIAALSGSAHAQDDPPLPESGNKFPLDNIAEVAPEAPPLTTTGTLAVRAVQGTPDAPVVALAPLKVEIIGNGRLINTLDLQLDQFGVAIVGNLPLGAGPIQVIAVVDYAGITYARVSPQMDAEHPNARVDVLCYETTTEPPAWTISMRHVMIGDTANGVAVNELLVINNPADQTWVGVTQPDGQTVTTVFPLPPGAHTPGLDRGFAEWKQTRFEDGALVNALPLMPGETEFRFNYMLPVEDGQALLEILAPAPTEQVMMVFEDTIGVDSDAQLQDMGARAMGTTTVRSLMSGALAEGERLSLRLTGFAPTAAGTGTKPTQSGGNLARWIAIVGGGLVVLVALYILVARSRPAGTSET